MQLRGLRTHTQANDRGAGRNARLVNWRSSGPELETNHLIRTLLERKYSMGHFYDNVTGEAKYTVIAKNGKERDTTLADARKIGLSKSVTTVIGQLDKPALTTWIKGQVLDAVMLYPFNGGNEEQWRAIILDKAGKKGKDAANIGTKIHDMLERHYAGEPTRDDTEQDLIRHAVNLIDINFGIQTWVPEKSFCYGNDFGGKVDLHSTEVLLDFKTKDSIDKAKFKAYPEHKMQLAAYERGLAKIYGTREKEFRFKRYANVFISSIDTDIVEIVEHTPEDIEKAWKMFDCLNRFWNIANNFER